MPDPRLLIDASLAPGVRLDLTEAQARHVTLVLRLGAGAGVRVFNARDGEWHAQISSVTKRHAAITIEAQLRPARACPDLDLLFAPVKRHATDLIVEKACELGVRRLRPVLTRRTIADAVRLDRLNLIAREAAEQTGRFDAPEICAALPLDKVLDGWDGARALIFADEEGEAGPIAVAAHALTGDRLAVLMGPEGGFDLAERRTLRALPFVTPVSLGPRILRAETAVIAALAVVQSLWGDWRSD